MVDADTKEQLARPEETPEPVEPSAKEDDVKGDAGTSLLEKTNDPVRMYLREMGTVPLLTREGEVSIARRIERGERRVLKASREAATCWRRSASSTSGSGRARFRRTCSRSGRGRGGGSREEEARAGPPDDSQGHPAHGEDRGP